MKTLYLDCGNGAAGDMISAALWELTENKEEFISEVNSIGIPGVKTYALPSQKQGIFGTHFRVTYNDIEEMPNVLPKDAIVELTPEEDLKVGHHGHDHECSCGHHHEHDHECSCGHHHEHDHECSCGHHDHHHEHSHGGDDKKTILLGAGCFVVGLILNLIGFHIGGTLAFVLGYLILGREVLATAWKNLTRGHVFDENFLMSVATIGAFLIGEAPEAVGVMLFYRVGEYFEHKAVERSRSQIMEAVDLRPEVVSRLEDGNVTVIPAEDAQIGDLLLIRPGDRIPLDGIVVSGESRIDTAPITGESVPVRVSVGDRVISGCVNTSGKLTVKVEKPLTESMVTRILNSVENAAASKPQIDRFITRFARIYTPIVVTAAALTALIPSLITGNWG